MTKRQASKAASRCALAAPTNTIGSPGSSEPTDLLWYDVTELTAVRTLLDQP